MSKKHKTNGNNNKNNKTTTPPQTSKRTATIAVGIILLAVAAVCVGLWWWKTNHAQASSPTAALAQPVAATAASGFEKLKGKWVRTDGGYVLEIKQVASDGKIDAVYLNPKSINVSKADASSDAGKMNVFVELRDRLYPGNYYKLTYDAGKDQLGGVYYHLGIQQQFDVIFTRIK
jgi:hypothetical protein